VLVEAAWSASHAPGPLRAFYQRVASRRGFQKAVVATARKMTVLAWHLVIKDQDYAFARPALVTHKRRKLELAAGAPSRRGNYGLPGAAYNDKQRRNEERRAVEQAEHAYQVLVAHWQPKRPRPPVHQESASKKPSRVGADAGNGTRLSRREAQQRGSTSSPCLCSSLGGHPRPPPPDVTAVLAAVKIVRPAGRSTLTAAAGRRSQAATEGKTNNPRATILRGGAIDIFIRRAHHGADLGVEPQERHKLRPRVLPQFDDRRVALLPGLGEGQERLQGGLL
jgi:hypothetical protein